MISIKNIEFQVTAKQVLEIPCLEIKPNEIIKLYGPNGCGKSSLLELIATFHPETQYVGSHKILINGRSFISYEQNELPIVVVWQDGRIFEHMSPIKNIEFPYKAANVNQKNSTDKAAHLMDAICTNLNFEELKTRRHSRWLSGGQKQAISIARALARIDVILKRNVSAFLLMDEGFDGLDQDTCDKAIEYIEFLVENENLGCLLISHRPEIRNKIKGECYKIMPSHEKKISDQISRFVIVRDEIYGDKTE